ncbi:Pectate lyase/Amb allergen [Rhodopirellula baltica SH28]|uniref:Pectate lyase/Amb allergen n=1 Tax=Rhodopirellula baltica SH28 TaxID=993517 RepID=K5DDH0_RHOBT|nr:right-handed parallel beta-helix repeat-containing protein [Rhodopirellula baltica]EKK00503.1 Pectate lyase/Amb allergen [Rhodopirellula baltica SH28]
MATARLKLPSASNSYHSMANLSMNDHPSNPLLVGLLSIFFAAFVWTSLASAEESDAPIGWASVSGRGVETTTGGRNGDVVTARTAEKLAEYASRPEPLTILIEGTITGDGQIKISSNKTLLGLGASTSLKNIELNMSAVSNIIIRNLHISDARDAIALRRTHHVWVDHCNLSECGDGLLDITHQSDFVTVSWTRFSKHHKTILINSGTSQPEDSGYLNTTIHHCWFDGSDTRNPRVGYGKVHVFNCLYTKNDYGIGLHSQCLVLAERNHFDQVKHPIKQMYRPDPTDIHHGFCESVENVFQDCRGAQDDEGKSFSVKEFYEYESKMDDVARVPEIVQSNAGPQEHIGRTASRQ